MRSENALPAAASGGLAKENRERDNRVLFLTYPVSGYAGQDQTSPPRIQCLVLGMRAHVDRGKDCCLELLHAWIGANIRKWSGPVASGLLINGGPHSSRYDAALCMVRKTTRRGWPSSQPRHLPKVAGKCTYIAAFGRETLLADTVDTVDTRCNPLRPRNLSNCLNRPHRKKADHRRHRRHRRQEGCHVQKAGSACLGPGKLRSPTKRAFVEGELTPTIM